jgi:hypothetical protein
LLESVEFGNGYDQPTNNLPPLLKSVKFGNGYNQETNNLPASVTHVEFGFWFNKELLKLPSGLLHLHLDKRYTRRYILPSGCTLKRRYNYRNGEQVQSDADSYWDSFV